MGVVIKDPAFFEKLLVMNGYSKREFSRVSGISYFMVFQMTKGKRNPSPKTSKLICDILNVDFDELFQLVYEDIDPREEVKS
ncbi:helix-turn-helix domain-containing protein [Alkalicoccus chagannorensis]|uniref:helix-turn-helix domain-containing protein n=1 Tax=Alkalicoccus chagannorensis TaxID=427072 RepID=UPI0006871844|nr:helix-turn-helix transcriptional regulator [Alkalicoccus chagannorensis]